MPATGKTPIQFYRSTTSGNVPSAANLSPGELALNIADTDMTMYFENASGVVKRFFNNPAELKYPTADGTSGQGVKTDGSKTLSFGALASAAITNNTRQAVTSSATTTINLASGQVIDLTMAANITTLSFTNVPASGTPVLVQIVVRNASDGTAYTIAWPNSVYWSGQYSATTISTVQTAPTLASGANGVTTIALLTTDGGTKWRGWVESLIPGAIQGSLYMWGSNAYGRVGNNTANSSAGSPSSPVQIGSLTNWLKVEAVQRRTFWLKTDGTIWVCGYNNSGALGLNLSYFGTARSSPTQIGSLTGWTSIEGNTGNNAGGIKNGELYMWGYGGGGRLGDNNTVSRSSPVQVGSLNTWSKLSIGYDFSLAIKTDGTLWSWGVNGNGQLGQNSAVSRSSPVQIGSDTNWSECAAGVNIAFAIKTTGSVWSWGQGSYGQLGQNDTVNRSSPTQIGSLLTWAKIITGFRSTLAIKTDNTLWGWGKNESGSLGLNSVIETSSPTQIGTLQDWSSVGMNDLTCMAIKTNGTLWGWGYNTRAAIGVGTTAAISSPVQVGSETNWTQAKGGGRNSTGSANGAQSGGIRTVTVNPA